MTREHHADGVIQSRGTEEQKKKFPIPTGVERIAANEQPNFARGIVRHRPVNSEDNEKEPNETKFNEGHWKDAACDPSLDFSFAEKLREFRCHEAREFLRSGFIDVAAIDPDLRPIQIWIQPRVVK